MNYTKEDIKKLHKTKLMEMLVKTSANNLVKNHDYVARIAMLKNILELIPDADIPQEARDTYSKMVNEQMSVIQKQYDHVLKVKSKMKDLAKKREQKLNKARSISIETGVRSI